MIESLAFWMCFIIFEASSVMNFIRRCSPEVALVIVLINLADFS